MWLEHLARSAPPADPYPFPFAGNELDYRPLLHALITDRLRGCDLRKMARAFQLGIANGVAGAVKSLAQSRSADTVVLSGGVFQNALLLSDVKGLLGGTGIEVVTNHWVPPNDGGISLGQAALAVFQGTHPAAGWAATCNAQNEM